MIFAAAGFQSSNWDGIAALASLEMYSTDSSYHPDLDSLNQVLDIVKAGLFPVIVANELKQLRIAGGVGSSGLAEYVRIFNKVELDSEKESNHIFKDALTTLETLTLNSVSRSTHGGRLEAISI